MNPNDEIEVEHMGNMVAVRISAALQRVYDRADTDPRMLALEQLLGDAEDGAMAELILREMAKRLEELARVEDMQ